MLVLTRKLDERILCRLPDGTEIALTVCEIASNSVRIGIDAPRNIPILRDDAVKQKPKEPTCDTDSAR
jgi:carbon storage regulator